MESNQMHGEGDNEPLNYSHIEIRAQLLEAERAAAAPYISKPAGTWWQAALISLAGPLFVLSISPDFRSFGALSLLPSLIMLGIAIFIIVDQHKRRGVTPRGKAPVELRPVYLWYFIGAAVYIAGALALGYTTPLWVSAPVSYVVCFMGLSWFGTAYERACDQVRARLA